MKLKHLTPLLLIVSTLFFVANANAEWKKDKLFSDNKTEFYTEERVRYEGRNVYLWELQNYINGHTSGGMRSSVIYVELDCSARRYRNLSIESYRANMGEGKPAFGSGTVPVPVKWIYPRPDEKTFGGFQTRVYCDISDKALKEGLIK